MSPSACRPGFRTPRKIAANGNGRILTNYDGYSSRYHGLELSLVKRMSDRWMARVGAAWNNATEHYSTNPPLDSLGNPTPLDTEPLDNGGPFTVRSSASGVGDMFIHGKWQLSANALYVLPANIELGASLFGRQGYPVSRCTAMSRSDGTARDGCWCRPTSTRSATTTCGTSIFAWRVRS